MTRTVKSRGTVLVDPAKALEKLRQHQLAESGLYVLELVRVAVLSKATEIRLTNDSDDFVLDFDGDPLRVDDLATLFDHLFSADRRLRLLAVAVNTAMAFRPRYVDLYTPREGATVRVRWLPSDDLSRPVTSQVVSAPEGLSPGMMRVHLREAFGLPVVKEWLSQEPAETALLRRRIVGLSVPLRARGEALRLITTVTPRASVALTQGDGVRGSLTLLEPGAEPALLFSELGVALEARALSTLQGLPLRLHLDADELPTNVSRSQVNLDGAFGHLARRVWNDAVPRLLEVANAVLAGDDPTGLHHEALRESLAQWITAAMPDGWVEAAEGLARDDDDGDAALGMFSKRALRTLLALPVLPNARGAWIDAETLRVRRGRASVQRRVEALPEEMSPWLEDVIVCPPDRTARAALLRPLRLPDCDAALAAARAVIDRVRAFHAQPVESPALPLRDDVLLRVPLRDDDDPTLRGELVVLDLRPCAPGPVTLTVFVEGRRFVTESPATAAVPVLVAVESARLKPMPAFESVLRDEGFAAVIALVRARLVEALGVLAAARFDGLAGDDPRGAWVTRRGRVLDVSQAAALVRQAWVEAVSAKRVARTMAEHPSLLDAPAWASSEPDQFLSTRGLLDAARSTHAVLFAREARGARSDGRPVVVVIHAHRATLEAMVEAATPWVDVTDALPTRRTRDLVATLDRALEAARMVPWRTTKTAHGSVAVAPAYSARSVLARVHSGALCDTRSFHGLFGDVWAVVDDDRFVPVDGGVLRSSEPDDLTAQVRVAEVALVEALARALQGDARARDVFDEHRDDLAQAAVLRLLVSARVTLDARVPPDAPVDVDALRALLDETPMIPRWSPAGRVERVTPAALRAAFAGDGTVPFLAEAPGGVEGEDFAPLILASREMRALVGRLVGLPVASAHTELPRLRAARQRRLALDALRELADAVPPALGDVAPPDAVMSVNNRDGSLDAALTDPADAWLEVLVEDRPAVRWRAARMPYPFVARARLRDLDGLSASLDGTTDRGQKVVDALLDEAAIAWTERVLTRAESGADVGDTGRALVFAAVMRAWSVWKREGWRERVRDAPMWLSLDGSRVSLRAAAPDGHALCAMWGAEPWIPPTPDEPRDPVVIAIADEAWKALLKRVTGDTPRDVTDAMRTVWRRRRLWQQGADRIALPGQPAHPSLGGRVERLAPKLGYGELRWVDRAPELRVTVHFTDGTRSDVALPAPVSVDVALASPDLAPGGDLDRALRDLDVTARVVDAARALLREALSSHAALPAWASSALRWHVLTQVGASHAERGREVFVDTAGAAMSYDELTAQERIYGAAAYVTAAPRERCAPGERGRRVAVLTPQESAWLAVRMRTVDYQTSLDEDLAALVWARSEPMSAITVPRDDVRAIVRERVREPAEGEVMLLPWDAPPRAMVSWHRGRRPLGAGSVATVWPALVAVEAPSLTPNRRCSAPVDDLALHEAQLTVERMVRECVQRQLRPRGDDVLACVSVMDRRSPAADGDAFRAVGFAWLSARAIPGRIDVRAGEGNLTMRGEANPTPVSLALWMHRTAGPDERAWRTLATDLAKWSWKRLLESLSDRVSSRADAWDDEMFAHWVWAALEAQLTTSALKDVARARMLPGSRTTLFQLQTAARERRTLRAVPPGDARATRPYFVTESGARWFAMLEDARMFDEPLAPAAPKPSAPPPPAEPPRSPTPPRWTDGDRVLAVLRQCGVDEGTLRAVELDDEPCDDGDAVVFYVVASRTAELRGRHAVVAALDQLGGAGWPWRVAMLTLAAIGRAMKRPDLEALWLERLVTLSAAR